jgi:alanyl-tRNA synthetase
LVAHVPNELTSKFQANKLIQQIAPIVGGKGGGRPESAQGAGKRRQQDQRGDLRKRVQLLELG